MSPKIPPLVLYGSTGHARSIRELVLHGFGTPPFEVVAYIDDYRGDHGSVVDGIPVVGFETWKNDFLSASCVVAVGDPAQRKDLVERISAAGGTFGTLCSIQWPISSDVVVGEGSIVAPPAYIGSATRIGRHVQIMPMTTIGHDCNIGDFSTICPSASISGNVAIEEAVFIGVGATVVNGTDTAPLRIGAGAKIYAGSVVMKSVAPGASVAGNPARDIRSFLGR